MEILKKILRKNLLNHKKTQIILTDTKRGVKNYIQSLRYRYNRKNPYIPNYVISKTGEVYKIMEPNMYSRFLDNETLDMKSIVISLENFGCLKKNPLEDTYVNWIGDRSRVYITFKYTVWFMRE